MQNTAFFFFFFFLFCLFLAFGDNAVSNSREETQNADEDHKIVCWRDTHNERELEACLSNQASRAEDKLNKLYKELMASLPKASRVKLQEAQRAWVTRRKRECAAQVQFVEECVNDCGVPASLQVAFMTGEAETRTERERGRERREQYTFMHSHYLGLRKALWRHWPFVSCSSERAANKRFEGSAEQRRCSVPVALRAPAPPQPQR